MLIEELSKILTITDRWWPEAPVIKILGDEIELPVSDVPAVVWVPGWLEGRNVLCFSKGLNVLIEGVDVT
jgi:hypothetical protein